MRPTEILTQEHRVIEQMLDCLDEMVRRCEFGGTLDSAAARKLLDFFRTFADRCHHGKEESHLFPLLEARGFSREFGPTGVMLHEHDEGRRFVRTMLAAVEGAEAGETPAREQFVQSARAFGLLLRTHIQKEDHCLFPMADMVLTAEDDSALVDQFDHVEQNVEFSGEHERCLKIAAELAEQYGLEKIKPATTTCGHHQCRH